MRLTDKESPPPDFPLIEDLTMHAVERPIDPMILLSPNISPGCAPPPDVERAENQIVGDENSMSFPRPLLSY